VIGLKNQGDIHDVGVELVRHFALKHVKKIGGDIEIGIWIDRIVILTHPFHRRHDRRKSSRQTGGDSDTCFARKVA